MSNLIYNLTNIKKLVLFCFISQLYVWFIKQNSNICSFLLMYVLYFK